MPGKFNRDFHPVMLPILLMMTQNGREMEKSLDDLASLIQSTKSALESMRNGVETFHAGLMKMAPPGAQPGWPPTSAPQEMDPAKPLPLTETDSAFKDSPAASGEDGNK
ncbi:MAG: hypothetical protein K6T66_02685 [Peptococcaceae bacterium]|nr:hypothetical protein [Peptococcaceae bacterium]